MTFAKRYIAYRRRAVNRHGVHSPFVYDLIENVFRNKKFENEKELRALRTEMLRNTETIQVNDLGAGSRVGHKSRRAIHTIVKTSATPLARAAMLQRLVDYMGYKRVLELGTNLGLTTSVLASAKTKPQLISLEGCGQLAGIAVKNMEKLNLNARIIVGDFKDNLDLALHELRNVDMAYLDGNHKKQATLAYFEKIIPAMHNDSVMVVGDIHWSNEMEEAWAAIKNKEQVRVTIDLFDMGLVFFRKEITKQNFTIRY